MKPLDWDHIQEIFHTARALPHEQHNAFVVNACAGDPDCVREVNSLLSSEASDDILEIPVFQINPTRELVGTTIGERYFVKRELGGGGMSRVYVALDRRLIDQPVVIKVLSQRLVQDQDARRRFDQEVSALLQIDHPGVVGVSDRGDLPDGRPYIVMKYIDGETLSSRISNQGMDLESVRAILKQVGDALDYVHQQGVFHRDVKPENIMLKAGTNSVVVIDFGIAKVQNPSVPTTETGRSAGTLNYMSPEQVWGEKVTAASDVYSMAVVAYEMVTGRTPFNPNSPSHLLELQRAGVRVRPRHLRQDLPHEAERTILRALSFDPKSRYQSAKVFGDNLANALVEPRKEPWNLRPWATAVGGLVALAVLCFVIYKIHVRPTIPPPNRSFTYWLTMGKPDGTDYQSNGDGDVFESGDKFQFNVESPIPAYFYIFNEGPSESVDTNFRMIYPAATINGGAASVGPNQPIQFEWMAFHGPPGDDNFWIVWSLTPVTQLEYVKTEAFKHPRGGLTNQSLATVQEFLRTQPHASIWHYKESQTAVPRGKGDILVALAQFKHR